MKAELKNQTLDIGEVARLSGVPPSAIRFYEERSLIRSVGRNGLRRLFRSHVLEQLEFISLGQTAGLSLDDIAKMFTVDGKLNVNRKFLIEKADEMQRNLNRLSAVRETVLHVAKCSATNHMECPKFQKLLRIAGRKKKLKQ